MFLITLWLDYTGGIWVFLISIFIQDGYGVESTGNPTENDGINNCTCCSFYVIDISKLYSLFLV